MSSQIISVGACYTSALDRRLTSVIFPACIDILDSITLRGSSQQEKQVMVEESYPLMSSSVEQGMQSE